MKFAGAAIAVLAALAAWAGGDEYHQRTPDQKRAQDELLFLLTFDGFNARADVAKGGGDSFAAQTFHKEYGGRGTCLSSTTGGSGGIPS